MSVGLESARALQTGPQPGPSAIDQLRSFEARTRSAVARISERRLLAGIGTVATLASVVATVLVYRTGNFAGSSQGDVFAHLLAARRVVDSATPGFAQIGQYWPPLFHVMEVPFAAIGPLYRSGLAGSIPAMAAYVVGVLGAYRLGADLTGDRRSGLVAAFAYGANPNLLFVQSLPMMESTIAATHVWAAASLAGFVRRPILRGAISAGAWTALACWSHYAAWALPFYGAAVIAVVAYRRGFSRTRTEVHVLAYAGLGVFAITLWLAWGFYLQHDPFYFLNTAASNPAAETQAAIAEATANGESGAAAFFAGRQGNLAFATLNYGLTVWHMIGPAAVALCVVVVAAALVRRVFIHPVGASAVTAAFVVAALWAFGGALGSPAFADLSGLTDYARASNHNVRFGLYLVPLWAGVAALCAAHRLWRQSVVVACVLATVVWFSMVASPFESLRGQDLAHQDQARIAEELRGRYEGGRILIAQAGPGDRMIWLSGLDASQFITEANHDLFARTVDDPRSVAWAVAVAGDDSVQVRSLRAAGFVPVVTLNKPPFRLSLWENT